MKLFFGAKNSYDLSEIYSSNQELTWRALESCLAFEGAKQLEPNLIYLDEENEIIDVVDNVDLLEIIERGCTKFYQSEVGSADTDYEETIKVTLSNESKEEPSKAELLKEGFLACWECAKRPKGPFRFGDCKTCQNQSKVRLTEREEFFRDHLLDAVLKSKEKMA